MDMPVSFIRIIILFGEAFKYDDVANFRGYVVKIFCFMMFLNMAMVLNLEVMLLNFNNVSRIGGSVLLRNSYLNIFNRF
jgi:hypothetical protein